MICFHIVISDMTWTFKSEKRLHHNNTCVLSYTGNQYITLSKPKLCVIGVMGTIADFAVKPLSSKQLCKHLMISSDWNCSFKHYLGWFGPFKWKFVKQVLFKDYANRTRTTTRTELATTRTRTWHWTLRIKTRTGRTRTGLTSLLTVL